MEAKYELKRPTRFAIQAPNNNQDAMALLRENKQLKQMLLLHLNVIQEQNDLIVAKDKQLAALQTRVDELESKNAGQENDSVPQTTQLAGVVPTGLVGGRQHQQQHIRPVMQQLSRGQLMKMASLNQSSGGQLRIRPLMISLKKVMPQVVSDHHQLQSGPHRGIVTTIKQQPQTLPSVPKTSPPEEQNSKLSSSQQPWIQYLNTDNNSTTKDTKVPQQPVKEESPDDTKPPPKAYADPPKTYLDPLPESFSSSPLVTASELDDLLFDSKPTSSTTPPTVNGKTVGVVPTSQVNVKAESESVQEPQEEEEEEDEIILMDTDEPPELIVSDGSPIDIPIELKLDEDDDILFSGSSISPNKPPHQQQQLQLPPTITTATQVGEAGQPVQIKQTSAPVKVMSSVRTRRRRRSPASAPRKYSRVMSTQKLYVSRHWEDDEDVDEANSLVVPELKEGESNLEVPHWKEIDAQGLEEEILAEEAVLSQTALAEDQSAAAYLKRHAKHEADERRRKKWDIQRFREQRTIEKLKKRQCKSDIYYSISGMPCSNTAGVAAEDSQQSTEPLSLYPSLSSIRHVETTEYLPVQAFGEPIPSIVSGEFGLPWMAAGQSESVEVMVGSSQPSSQQLAVPEGCPGDSGGGSKYSSFFVKQNGGSSSVPVRGQGTGTGGMGGGSSNSAKYRFKRVKSQGSNSGRR